MPRAALAEVPGVPWPQGEKFRIVRAATEALTAPLSAEDQQIQSMPDASPSKWHLAHTSWFFETFVLEPHRAGYQVFHPRYRFLFNSYYEAVGERPERPRRGLLSRPTLDEVRAYRQHVDTHMIAFLRDHPPDDLTYTIALGLHHEQQHQELMLTDIKHALGTNPLRPAYQDAAPPAPVEATPLAWRKFDGGLVPIGHAGEDFAFDNETPVHQVFLRPFALASRLVTAGEYLAFMRDGGYQRAELWLSDGWKTVQAEGWRAPLYWEERDGSFWQYTLSGMRLVDPAEPVCHVSYYEADAFARWAGARLPTEFEWEHAAVGARATSTGAMLGDAWQWTCSAYAAYPGYAPAAGALGEYNGKFMCNQMVLRGGSCLTPRGHIRPSYRNFFPPDARWQMSGIRLAQDG